MRLVPALIFLAVPCFAAAAPQVRVGLDSQALEWTVSLEGGGSIQSRQGQPLMQLKDGEKLRIWWDSKGEADPTDEYRVQVGPPVPQKEADALIQKLKALGEQPERVAVPDGGTWRVLTGHYAGTSRGRAAAGSAGRPGLPGPLGRHREAQGQAHERPGPVRHHRALRAPAPARRRGAPGARPRELTSLAGKGRYRGRVEIFPNAQGRLTVVNTLDLETYLRGVVPREMGAWEFPAIEALKAQAVAARTYAYVNLGKRAKEGFDLVDTVADQVYGGRDGEQALTDRAVAETAGLIATYGGQPHPGAVHGQRRRAPPSTTPSCSATPTPYLKGVSNYAANPKTLPFKGSLRRPGRHLAHLGDPPAWRARACCRPATWTSARMNQPMRAADLRPVLEAAGPAPGPAAAGAGARERPPALPLDGPQSWASRTWWTGMERPQDAAYLLGDAAAPARGPAPGLVPHPARPGAALGPGAPRPQPGPGPAGAGPALAGAGAGGVPGRHPAAATARCG